MASKEESTSAEDLSESHEFLNDAIVDIEELSKFVCKINDSLSVKTTKKHVNYQSVVKNFKQITNFMNVVKNNVDVINSVLTEHFIEWCNKFGLDKITTHNLLNNLITVNKNCEQENNDEVSLNTFVSKDDDVGTHDVNIGKESIDQCVDGFNENLERRHNILKEINSSDCDEIDKYIISSIKSKRKKYSVNENLNILTIVNNTEKEIQLKSCNVKVNKVDNTDFNKDSIHKSLTEDNLKNVQKSTDSIEQKESTLISENDTSESNTLDKKISDDNLHSSKENLNINIESNSEKSINLTEIDQFCDIQTNSVCEDQNSNKKTKTDDEIFDSHEKELNDSLENKKLEISSKSKQNTHTLNDNENKNETSNQCIEKCDNSFLETIENCSKTTTNSDLNLKHNDKSKTQISSNVKNDIPNTTEHDLNQSNIDTISTIQDQTDSNNLPTAENREHLEKNTVHLNLTHIENNPSKEENNETHTNTLNQSLTMNDTLFDDSIEVIDNNNKILDQESLKENTDNENISNKKSLLEEKEKISDDCLGELDKENYSVIILDSTLEDNTNDEEKKSDNLADEADVCDSSTNVTKDSKIGVLKLVDLNKLIDKPKAWLHEALSNSPNKDENIIILNSSSDSEYESSKKVSSQNKIKNKNLSELNKSNTQKNKYSETDESDSYTNSEKKRLQSRNKKRNKKKHSETDDSDVSLNNENVNVLTKRRRGERNTDKFLKLKSIREQRKTKKHVSLSQYKSDSSDEDSNNSEPNNITSKTSIVKLSSKKKEQIKIDINDKKIVMQCKVLLERMTDDINSCFQKWKQIQDEKEIKRLTDIDMLKTKRKRTDGLSNLSDSNSSNDKLYQKKKQAKSVDQQEKASNGKSVSSDNTSDDCSTPFQQIEKNVSVSDTPMVIFSSSGEESNDNDVNDSDIESSKQDSNNKHNKNENQTDRDEVKKENIEESSTKNKKNNKSDEEMSNDSASKTKESWKKDKLLTDKLNLEKVKELNSSEEEQKYKKKKEKLNQKEKKEKKQQKKRFRIFTSESESGSESKTEKNNIKNEDKNEESDNDKKSSNSEGSSGEFFQTNLKRKKAATSSEKNSSDEESHKKKKIVRKRIKRIKDSDDSSEDEDGKTKTRKNIRSVIKDDSLSKSTREAAKEEEKRKKRIAERQKMYNEMFEMDNETDKRVDKVVLDFNTDTKKELLAVHPKLVEKLKPHQAKGVKFMYEACFESLERSKKEKGSGCILAHCMGLGKTLQVITLIHTLLTNKKTGVHTAMVVCPLSTVLNWVNEFKIWLNDINDGDDVNVFELSRYKKNYERAYQIDDWQECGGVLVIGYEMYRILCSTTNKKIRKKVMNSLQKGLVDPGPDLVVCDEGHLLKNEKSRLSITMNKLKTLRRIILTGTPLQNNLREYYCMIQFVKPYLLGKYSEYTNRFVNPITNGQYTDSTLHDIAVMKRRSHVLHKMLNGVVERRDYSVLAPFLPPKHEYVIFLRLTDIQVKLYEIYMKDFARRGESGRAVTLFNDFQELQRIWTHPRMMRAHSDKYERTQEKKAWLDEDSEGSLKDFIDDDDDISGESSSESDISVSSDGSSKPTKKVKAKAAPVRRRTRAMAAQMDEEDDQQESVEESKPHNPTEWWVKYIEGDELDNIDHSAKLLLLFDILKKCEAIGDKLLVFSQSLYSLNLIEYFLEKVDEATQNGTDTSELLHGHKGSWALGLDYFRLDGSSSVENRAAWCKSFNSEDNIRARLFLISTKAGGLGINLVAANRVIIFDVSWNPSHDIQSIFRIYRFGQKKPCYVYRFIAMGTMEEKVYERQVTKQAISKRVIDEQQIDRHYNQNDLAELYKFAPVPEGDRPIPMLPKDRMFAELLQEYETLIYRYHEHDSLLENKEEEELDEDERKAAWEEFENEKTAKPAMNNVVTGVTRQAQIAPEQAAYIIQMMLRQENPQWTSEQVRQGVPVVLQQMYANAVAGDWTVYNRVVGYQQHLTFQQQLLAAQTRLMNPSMQNQAIYNMHNSGIQNVFVANEKARQAQYQANQNRMYTAGIPSTSTQNQQFDPNEVVNID